jgi:two-component system nitrate/nitrite response regulator NarL
MSASAPATTIRVLAADDQPLYLEALARLVRQRSYLQLVAEARDGTAALVAIRRAAPDVAVIAAALPARVLEAVVRERLPTRVLVLAGDDRFDGAYAAIARGARGYLSKLATPEQLDEAIRRVAGGHVVIAPDAQNSIADAIRLRADRGRGGLTRREREILALMSEGLSARQIGDRLQVGTSTVKTHMLNLYDKLGVSERAAAVAQAMRRGLLE